MNAKNGAAAILIGAAIAIIYVPAYPAQESSNQQQPNPPQSSDQQDKDKPTPEKKAVSLLDQVLSDAGSLKLPENRVYVQISAGDLLWDRDEQRARGLFSEAAATIADLMRRSDGNDRRSAQANRAALELRQELVLTVARHDGALAYQLLQSMPTPPSTPTQGPGGRRPDTQNTLEQSLVAAIAANDPKTALKNAQDWLNKGEYPASLTKVISQLQSKDPESAAKLTDQMVKRLQPEEMLAKQDAVRLTMALLGPGPRPDKKTPDSSQAGGQSSAQSGAATADQVLTEAAYRDVMSATITAALRAIPQAPGAQGGARGRQANPAPAASQSEADLAQPNARALLNGLQGMLQQVDQYLPDRGLSLRQKLTAMGIGNDPRNAYGRGSNLMQQGTSDSLMTAAASAPQGMQNRLYQQAAMKAIDEGNPDRAREIANQHLDGTTKDGVLRTADLTQATRSASANKMDEVRRTIASAKSDDERVSLLLQFANTLQSESPKVALQLLDEARGLVTRRASNYAQLEAQLNVAHALAQFDAALSFDTLEPGISQINDLVSAAAMLSGFELNIFKDGELPLQGGGSLTGMVVRYGTELAALARTDFEKAQMMSDRFVLAEPRILAKLSMVRGVLGATPIESANGGGRGGGQFGRRPQ
jgi:hypothetical protein